MIRFPVRKLASIRLAALLFCSLGAGQILSADSYTYTFTTFDGPGGSGSTYLTGINDSGQIIGTSNGQGFLYSNGVFSTLPASPIGISDNGTVVGNLPAPQGSPVTSYIYSNGNYSTFTAPNQSQYSTAFFSGVNDSGVIVGGYSSDPFVTGHRYFGAGFIYNNSNSTLQSTPTALDGINNAGTNIKTYAASVYFEYGYISDNSNPIYYPTDPTKGYVQYGHTAVYGINNSDQVLGSFSNTVYLNGSGYSTLSGYFIYSKGVFTDLNLPAGYDPLAFNDTGQLVGDISKAGGLSDGFIATPVPQVPEINSNSGASAVALLAGILLIVRRRQVLR